MSNISNNSLTVFITMQFINLGVLVADYFAKMNKLPEITTISVKYPVIAVCFVLIEFTSPISLALHFWYSKYPDASNSLG
jgi:hypothetical protein